MKVDRTFPVRRVLARLLVVLILVGLVALVAAVAHPAVAITTIVKDPGGHHCGPSQDWDPVDGKCEPGQRVDCGPDPTVFNLTGGHWQRLFNEFCAPYTPYGELEMKCHDKTCDECKAAVYPALVCTYKP